jgi:hypothetical protein
MQTVEDILYASHTEGIYDEVMKRATELTNLEHNKHRAAADIYHEAYMRITSNGIEIHEWESALIRCTEYQYHKEELIIEFNNGQRYLYKNFSKELYDSFMSAESKGKFFLSEIRKQFKDSENTEKL